MALSSKRPSKGEEARTQILSDLVDTQQDQKRLNVLINASLMKRLKLHSVENDRTIASIISELVENHLSK